MGNQGYYGGQMMRSDTPVVNIRYPGIRISFHFGSNFINRFPIDIAIEQNFARVDEQSVGPLGDHQGTDYAHDRVHPDPAENFSG